MRWRSLADPRVTGERSEKTSKLQLCHDNAGKERKLAMATRLAFAKLWVPNWDKAVK